MVLRHDLKPAALLDLAGRRISAFVFQFVLVVSVAGALGGCAVKLAPDYDKAIVEGLSSANEAAMTLFASVGQGGGKSGFAKREPTYNGLIGKFDAVRLQVTTRPAPAAPPIALPIPQIAFPANVSAPPQAVSGTKGDTAAAAPNATLIALEAMIDTFTKMRDRDRAGGLIPQWVAVYKSQYEQAMSAALTVEKALQR